MVKKPITWLRYIDDIFFIWNDSEEHLKLFINFCNSYAADNKMKSSIKFTVDYSKSEVIFLDTKVKFTDDKVATFSVFVLTLLTIGTMLQSLYRIFSCVVSVSMSDLSIK